MTQVINVRVTYRKSPIHVLERFTFKDVNSAYSSFKKHSGLKECVIVQTCNRVELFGSGEPKDVDRVISPTGKGEVVLQKTGGASGLELSITTARKFNASGKSF